MFARRFFSCNDLLFVTRAVFTIALLMSGSPSAQAQKAQEAELRDGLPHFFARAAHGADVRVGYLGGSITAAEGWRPLSFAWLQTSFPQTRFGEINAAVSGTGSVLGAFRLQHDVLQFKPNVLFVEFAVNDEDEPSSRIQHAMEGIVRQTWTANSDTDICFIYTLNRRSLAMLETGQNPPAFVAMERVASFYGIPSVNVGLAAAREIQLGHMTLTGPAPAGSWRLPLPKAFSADGTHPYPETGHQIYAQVLERALLAMRSLPGKTTPHSLLNPMDTINLGQAREVRFNDGSRSGHWVSTHLEDPTGQMARSLPEVWAAKAAGDSLSFTFTGTTFGIYGVKGPDAASFSVEVDDQPPQVETLLDAYSTAGRYRCRAWISRELPPGVHHARITVLGPVLNRDQILSHSPEPDINPPEANNFSLYVGVILVDGPLVSGFEAPHSTSKQP